MSATFVIAQGGGPTAVINQTLVGAVLEAKKRHPGAKVLGARHGVRGIRDGDYVDLSAVPEAQLRLIAGTPSAALGSTRDKPDAAYCEVMLAGPEEGRRRRLHLYRRQRHRRHAADPDRRGRRLDGLRACAQNHRQRPGRQRPHAGLHLGRRVRRRRIPQRRSRFPRAARRLCRHRHGPPCRLPDRSGGGLAARRRQRPASGLRAGARLFGAALHRRRAEDARPPQALHRRRVGRRLDRGRPLAGRKHRAGRTSSSATRMAMSSCRAPISAPPSSRRWPTACRASAPASTRWATCRAAPSR